LADGRLVARVALRGLLAPRAASPDGTLVALTAATVGEEPYRPAPRTRTTIVIVQAGGERTRIDLPGNLEPEAFSADGLRLFVLDYLPPTAPDRYRVRMLDLAQRSLLPLLTRAKSIVPAGAEEEMRGQGRQAVYDPRRQILFTLYTHQPGHQHTRDLVPGARPGAPHVHAFVHALSLRDQWAYCIDLPAPFGAGPPGRHAIALSGDRRRLAVVEAGSGLVAAIDPDGLKVASVDRFAPAAVAGHDAAARYLPDNALLVGAGREVVQVGPAGGVVRRWPARSPVRGLALHPDGARVYVGQYDAVVCHDVATGRELSRLPTPGLLGVQAALA
ncbi:MAG TPA: hypothetical protein VES42_05830, partial [Pilimelia sp.]|nr:hypothetical protein [Pilimelia sp.]